MFAGDTDASIVSVELGSIRFSTMTFLCQARE